MKAAPERGMVFNVLIKQTEDMFIAHCLELDIVATASTKDDVCEELVDLIIAQVDYAFSNNNLEHLYHPAPPEVWKEFFECVEETDVETTDYGRPFVSEFHGSITPPWIIAKACQAKSQCGVQ
jgi:hypothetical protein